MKLLFKLTRLVMLLLLITGTLKAQQLSTESIDNIHAEIIDNKLVISFDLNTKSKIESLWVDIRKADGTRIANNSLDEKIWRTVASVYNSRIVWEYPMDNTDLAGQDILIDVKAKVYEKPAVVSPPVVVNIPKEKPVQPKATARYPQFRTGLELTLQPGFWGDFDYGTTSATFTGEYIARPNFSLLSGLGVEYTSLDTYNSYQRYLSLLVPFTLEYKLNTGRFFRIYMGGGMMNRIIVVADDEFLTFGQGLKRYVLGAKAEAGIELWNLRLGLTFCQDLTSYSVLNEKNIYMGVTVGIRFGGSKAYIK